MSVPKGARALDPFTMRWMDPGESDSFDLDLAAASLRSNNTDVGMLLRMLVDQLGDALGKRLTVERAKGLMRKSNEIKAVQINLGEDELRAELDGSSVRCSIGHSSGGIRIRSSQVQMDEWLRRLLEGLKVEAAHSEVTRQALEHIVIGGAN